MTVYEEILTGEYSMSRRVAATIRKLRKQKKSLRAMAIKAGISTSQVYKAQHHYKSRLCRRPGSRKILRHSRLRTDSKTKGDEETR